MFHLSHVQPVFADWEANYSLVCVNQGRNQFRHIVWPVLGDHLAHVRLNQVDARIYKLANQWLFDDPDRFRSLRSQDTERDTHVVLFDCDGHISRMLTMELMPCPEVD